MIVSFVLLLMLLKSICCSLCAQCGLFVHVLFPWNHIYYPGIIETYFVSVLLDFAKAIIPFLIIILIPMFSNK